MNKITKRALLLPCIDSSNFPSLTTAKVYKIVGFWKNSNCIKVIDDYGDIINANGYRFGLKMKNSNMDAVWKQRRDHELRLPKSIDKKVYGPSIEPSPCDIKRSATYTDNSPAYFCHKHLSFVDYLNGLAEGKCRAVTDSDI